MAWMWNVKLKYHLNLAQLSYAALLFVQKIWNILEIVIFSIDSILNIAYVIQIWDGERGLLNYKYAD